MIGADFTFELFDVFDRRAGDEIVRQKYFEPHDHCSISAAHFGAGHGRSRAGDDLQLSRKKRHQRLRRALDVDDIDIEAVLLEDPCVFGDPKDGRRAGVGRNVSEV